MIYNANVLKENLKNTCVEIEIQNDNITLSEINKKDKIVYLCTNDIKELFNFLRRYYKIISFL